MKIAKKLSKMGIIPNEKIDIKEKINIAKTVTEKLTSNINILASSYNELYMRIYNCEINYAQIDPKFQGVFYYYKNNTIYIDRNKDNIEECLIHEIIHYLQNFGRINKKTKRAGLCKFMDFKIFGLGLNEAVVQYITAKAIGKQVHRISNEKISICTNSENYKYITSLVSQIIFLLGEEDAIKSCINSTEYFENILYNTFEDKTEKILKGFDILLDETNEDKIIDIYMQTQETIYKTYFTNICKRLTTIQEVDSQVEKLEEYQNIVGKLYNIPIDKDKFLTFKNEMDSRFLNKYVEINRKQSRNALAIVYKNYINNIFTKFTDFIQNKIIKTNK